MNRMKISSKITHFFNFVFTVPSESTTRANTDVIFSHRYVDHDDEYAVVNDANFTERDPRYSITN